MKSFEKLAAGAWLLLAAVAGTLAAGLIALKSLEALPLCAFKLWWGVACPGCGMAHALLFAFQGRWAESFRHHPLGMPLLALWTLWLLHGALNLRRGRPFSADFPLAIAGGRRAIAALAVLLSAYALRLAGIC